LQDINISSGFIKIFDEIIVNAADNAARNTNMKNIIITVKDDYIEVYNDGFTLPFEFNDKL
jgi:DNA topoisomerase-2